MSSVFINAGLAAGVALAALPVILHLLMRPTPKHVIFPALRLIRERQKRTKKKLRIKNWLLLLARMALIALMALALARPRLWSKASLGSGEVPTAMALVFDTSLSMRYKEKDQTRLEEAKARAGTLLARAHESSRVFVVDSADPIAPVALSPTAAKKRVEALTIRPVNRPLNAAVAAAYKAIIDAPQPRHEAYIFTDLARSAWDLGQAVEGVEAAKANKVGLATYIVRLTPKEPHNSAVVAAAPLAPVAVQDEQVLVQATLRNTGPARTRVAEFFVNGTKRGHQEVKLAENSETTVRFQTPKLAAGLHRGEVRLSGEPDPLEDDDRRYFTLEVQPAQPVLIVSDQAIDAEFVANALDPATLRTGGARPFPVMRISGAQLDGLQRPLREFAAVFLLNVRDLSETAWGRLNQYVRDGGGLVVAVGDRVSAEAWNQRGALLLPATLGERKQPKESPFTFGKADMAHPLFERNTRDLLAELARVPIYRYMTASPIQGARTLLSYQNNEPALLERVFPGPRAGKVLLWTTPLSRRPGGTPADRAASWNDFPLPTVGWSFFYLVNLSVPYLAGVTGQRLNYEAGENVVLPIDTSRRYTSYSVQGPGAAAPSRLGLPVSTAGLVITAPPLVGQWTVTATGPGGAKREQGFSVNVPQGEMQMTPLGQSDLAALFGGKDRYTLADDPERLIKVVTETRVGRELFPLIMALILLVLTLENLLANTFYRDRHAGAATASRTTRAAA